MFQKFTFLLAAAAAGISMLAASPARAALIEYQPSEEHSSDVFVYQFNIDPPLNLNDSDPQMGGWGNLLAAIATP